jgi:hypothetical protein
MTENATQIGDTPRTNFLLPNAPAIGPRELIEWTDAIIDSHRQLERELAAAQEEVAALKVDAVALDWIGSLFVKHWNGVVGDGSRVNWSLVGDWRHRVSNLSGNNFRAAIDTAIEKERKNG